MTETHQLVSDAASSRSAWSMVDKLLATGASSFTEAAIPAQIPRRQLTWSELAAALDDLAKGANLLQDPKAR